MENQNITYFDDDIDLKKYIRAVLRYWLWIVAAAILAGGLAFLYGSTQAITYTSTSLVSVSAPILTVEFDTSIRTEETPLLVQSSDLPNLALSDEVILNLFNNIQSELPATLDNYSDLKDSLEATTELRSQIVELKGTFADPELSALVINEWSRLFVTAANLFFEGPKDNSRAFLRAQLVTAEEERNAVDQEYVTFQTQNRTEILQTRLEYEAELQERYIAKRNTLEILLYDIEGINRQLASNPDNVSILSDLTLYALQNRAFSTVSNIQVDVTSFSNLSDSTLIDRVSQLISLGVAVESQLADLDARIAELDPIILDYQAQIETFNVQQAEIESRRQVAQNTYESLARKVAEAAIEQNDTDGKAQIASRAIPPTQANSRGRLTTSALAATVVGLLIVGLILVRQWWDDSEIGLLDTSSTPEQTQVARTAAGYTNGNGNGYVAPPANGNGHHPHPAEAEKEELPAND